MAKILKITFPENCIGCELCVLEVQRQLNKAGLDGSPIRIFRNQEEDVIGEVAFTIDMDKSVNELKIEKVKNICPTGVFTIEDIAEEEEHFLE